MPHRAAEETSTGFRSPEEAEEVLDRVLHLVDHDPTAGPLVRASGISERLRFDDLDLSVSFAPAEGEDRRIQWSFAERPPFEPRLSLTTDSATGNRLLQGRESIAIAIARGRVSISGDQTACLISLSLTRLIARHYEKLIRDEYPHLLVGE